MFTHYEQIRCLDMNMGQHLSNDKVLSFLTECNEAFFRSIGFTLGNFFGTTCVVSEAYIKFRKEIMYPDTLQINMTTENITKTRITFAYQCYNSQGQLSHEAKITSALVCNTKNRPARITQNMIDLLNI